MIRRGRHLAVAAVVIAALFVTAYAQDRRPAPVSPPTTQGSSGKRVALLVGNDAYPESPLGNAVNDATALGAALRDVGFTTTVVTNVRQAAFGRSVDTFVAAIQPGDVALFYYSGHGFQLDGENYLAPIDFAPADPTDAGFQAYAATRVQQRIAARQVSIAILVFDSCRNNPFRSVRATGGGWAEMRAARGAYLAFATAPGETASDNPAGGNGLFTTHFLAALKQPGLTLDQVFGEVGQRVRVASNNRQDPWVQSSAGVGGQFVFRRGAVAEDAGPRAVSATDVAMQVELAVWDAIKNTQNPSPLEDYLLQYPAGRFKVIAEARLAELRGPAPALSSSLGVSPRVVTENPGTVNLPSASTETPVPTELLPRRVAQNRNGSAFLLWATKDGIWFEGMTPWKDVRSIKTQITFCCGRVIKITTVDGDEIHLRTKNESDVAQRLLELWKSFAP